MKLGKTNNFAAAEETKVKLEKVSTELCSCSSLSTIFIS